MSGYATQVRNEVVEFAEAMEQKLRENDSKIHWRHCSDNFLIHRLKDEVKELEESYRDYKAFCKFRGVPHIHAKKPLAEVAKEAVDVANFAMMIFDKITKEVKNGV